MDEIEKKKQRRMPHKSLGTLIGLSVASIATIMGFLFWRKKRLY